MRVFVRVVDRRSFTRAADDLELPRSSTTDAIKGLEARLGVRLLQRTTRHVSPTLDGEAYYHRCVRVIAEVEDAESVFAGAKPQGQLHVSVHGTLASHFVVPHLPDFIARYPDIALQFSEGDRYVDLVREGMDCALRAGSLADSDLIARRLTVLEEITCASPAYLDRYGLPASLDDLSGHRMVGFRSSATGNVLPLKFEIDEKVREIILPFDLAVTGAQTYAAAARSGLGLIQAPRYRLDADLQQGFLKQVLPDAHPPRLPVSVLYPRTRYLSGRLRVFIDWMAERFQDAS